MASGANLHSLSTLHETIEWSREAKVEKWIQEHTGFQESGPDSRTIGLAFAHRSLKMFQSLVNSGMFDHNRLYPQTGYTLLHHAIWILSSYSSLQETHSIFEKFKALIESPKTDPNKKDNSGNPPLHRTTEHKTTQIMQMLMEHPDIDVNRKGEKGRTALFYATARGNVEAVKFLLSDSRVNREMPDAKGRTPLNWAKKQNYPERFQSIINLLEAIDK